MMSINLAKLYLAPFTLIFPLQPAHTEAGVLHLVAAVQVDEERRHPCAPQKVDLQRNE